MINTLIRDFLRVDKNNEYVLGRENYISKKFDEPTYLSFKIDFGTDDQVFHKENYVKNNLDNTNYDVMPHPLFVLRDQPLDARNVYSTISYLKDSNEFARAKMLEEFINGIKTIQNNYNYYFQQISGVETLLAVDPLRGQRVSKEGKITLTCLEGLDLKMTYFLNLYKKIAWDDTWQRWILPDIMRYFTLNIYISEFRTFHKPNQFSKILDNKNNTLANNITENAQTTSSIIKESNLILDVLDYIMPTWVISCEQCEIDITSIKNSSLSNLSVSEASNFSTVSFDIKIGNIREIQSYPIRKRIMDDLMINSPMYKSKEIETPNDFIISSEYSYNQKYKNLELVTTPISEQDRSHKSTEPYYETSVNNLLNNALNYTNVLNQSNINNDENKQSWIGKVFDNAVKTGVGWVENKIDTAIDTALTKPIKILGGTSISQIISAVQSANIVSMYGVINRSIKEQVNNMNVAPSSLLNDEIIYEVYTKALENIANSTATSEEGQKIINASRELLTNTKLFYASLNDISNKNTYRDDVNKTINNDRSHATELDGGPNKILNG